MTDVRLFQSNDGGEIEYLNGNPTLADGLETSVYLSLFGGNAADSGTEADDPLQWWGNHTETEDAKKYRSETQQILLGSGNLAGDILAIESAAQRDLQWQLDEGIADDISIEATVPDFNTLQIEVTMVIGDSQYSFEFTQTSGGN